MSIKRLTVEIDEKLHAEVKSRAYAEGKSIKEKIIELLEGWLKK
jgi:predicted HicB family RNase H-like nuclease